MSDALPAAVVSVRASRALSMPVAFREPGEEGSGASRSSRFRVPVRAGVFFPDFEAADLALGREASSAARRASFSPFLRAASAALAEAASLGFGGLVL